MGTSAQASALFFNFFNDPAALSPEERLQAVFAAHGALMNFQTSFMLANEGTLDSQIKDAILEALVVVKDKPGFKYHWEQRSAFFYEEFQSMWSSNESGTDHFERHLQSWRQQSAGIRAPQDSSVPIASGLNAAGPGWASNAR